MAVCDFCKKRESELYQKEVCFVHICINHGKLVFISWSVSFRSLICRLWRRNSLVCGLSVSAVKGHFMKMCCVPGIYTLGLDNIKYSLVWERIHQWRKQYLVFFLFQSRLSHLLHEEESAERFRRPGEAHLPFWLVIDDDLFFFLHSFFILPQWRRICLTSFCKESFSTE